MLRKRERFFFFSLLVCSVSSRLHHRHERIYTNECEKDHKFGCLFIARHFSSSTLSIGGHDRVDEKIHNLRSNFDFSFLENFSRRFFLRESSCNVKRPPSEWAENWAQTWKNLFNSRLFSHALGYNSLPLNFAIFRIYIEEEKRLNYIDERALGVCGQMMENWECKQSENRACVERWKSFETKRSFCMMNDFLRSPKCL